jgi:hypothetical protein
MMARRTNLNLKAEFREYYLEAFANRPAGIYDELEAAYIAGAREMAQDTLDTLGDYACACAGLEPRLIKPETVYDTAEADLMVYYAKILDNAESKYSDIVSDGGMDPR